jgi:hypothetical protein
VAKRSSSPTRLEQQIKALGMRVSFLERALKPRLKNPPQLDEANKSRERAEEDARTEALKEYYNQKNIEFYLRNPGFLARELAAECEKAEFLKSRGLKPEPSRIPEQFHRGLKGYRPKAED